MNQRERDRLEREREGDRRFYLGLFGFLAGLFAVGLIAIVALAISGDIVIGASNGSEAQPTATQASTTQTQTQTQAQAAQPPAGAGKGLFASNCGTCHTLAAAGTTGTVGPNLDQLKPDQTIVKSAIQTGPGAMPANLLSGAQAQQVAAFVASSAGH